MKLLYVSGGHVQQCIDDCTVWSDLNIEWYSTGYYAKGNGNGNNLPRLKNYYANQNYRRLLKKEKCKFKEHELLESRYITYAGRVVPNIWNFSKEFIDQFDIILFNHDISNVINNLEVLKNKTVIFKTFGMHYPDKEQKIGVLRAAKKIIRVSNSLHEDRFTPLYGGVDYIIHSSVVPDDKTFNNWNGNKEQVCIFCNGFQICQNRRSYYKTILKNCPEIKFLLYGANNENDPLSYGFCSLKEKIKIMKDSRISLIVGTPGSSYTFSLSESTIMGCPTVCYGKKIWDSPIYEIDELFSHGKEILIGETPEECADYIKVLMQDKNLCEYLGKNARKKSLEIFGREAVANEWKKLFNDCGANL